ncbi:hypothetical protein [Actinomadura mexicana]|uniref:Uncharacterized protein n=1 Tax=Actinomadura mexicana TaxID=134959 RepID=A0A239ACN5_9ACTN|nr:hypothetical protein [Actinomadura mexicana]SNR92808.1 hypothetical protein SAMN06265355_108328 [Actinomadura mexicana]
MSARTLRTAFPEAARLLTVVVEVRGDGNRECRADHLEGISLMPPDGDEPGALVTERLPGASG